MAPMPHRRPDRARALWRECRREDGAVVESSSAALLPLGRAERCPSLSRELDHVSPSPHFQGISENLTRSDRTHFAHAKNPAPSFRDEKAQSTRRVRDALTDSAAIEERRCRIGS
jgi:hypothetical protein